MSSHHIPTFSLDSPADTRSGLGAIECAKVRFPLIGLDVRTTISELTARTQLKQRFRNPLDESLEATYIFPLPDRSAVTSFRLRAGHHTVEGKLREREAARQRYEDAIRRGRRAAIAEEERSGVYTIRVGNLPAGETVHVELEFEGPIDVSDGEGTYRFPFVVAPRYTPGLPLDRESVGKGTTPDTDLVPDASRVTPPVLLPGFPNPVELSLEVQLDIDHSQSEDWRKKLCSSLHSVICDEGPPCTVRLSPGERLDRDFVLRFPIGAASEVTTRLQSTARTNGKDGVFALTLVPPRLGTNEGDRPRKVVFVLDRSGSMRGWKIVAARRSIGRMLDTLLNHDEFSIIAFSDQVATDTANGLTLASNRARWRSIEWLGGIDAGGGTNLGLALVKATEILQTADADDDKLIILVTDGQVSGEDILLKTLQAATGGQTPRICSVGIDQAVNSGFLNRLAETSRGRCEFVESEDRLDDAMSRPHRMIRRPIVRKLQISAVNFDLDVESLAPSRLPDLFPGCPVTVFGRHCWKQDFPKLTITGVDQLGSAWRQDISARPAIPGAFMSLWGRAKVRELEDQYASGQLSDPDALARNIVKVALEAGVLSRFTAYVAVDMSQIVEGSGMPREIVQPVALPAGWQLGRAGRHPAALSCLRASVPADEESFDNYALAPTKQATDEAVARFRPSRPPNSKALIESIQKALARVLERYLKEEGRKVTWGLRYRIPKLASELVSKLRLLAASLQQTDYHLSLQAELRASEYARILDSIRTGGLDDATLQGFRELTVKTMDQLSKWKKEMAANG